jgi:uncharacterized circularly permuted ATP-grasp superfamily protein/uncharacterized alpha-E superfamily protein
MTGMAAIDEMVTGRGGVRPHWSAVLGALSSLDPEALAERARRLDLAAEEEGAAPSWRCDPVPLPLTATEFAQLEDGLSQRARLLEAILADLYGPQRTLDEGWLPPALVHANPGYLRACRTTPAEDGHAPAGRSQRYLQMYSADLVRGPDGQWRVLADRTGGSLGIGYARESRRLLARVLPELFRSAQVRQLRPFFEGWQDALLRLGARPDGRPPVVAMLTPGPSDPHWPEHLALSRDLACALVESRDLTVRGGVLSIKTLEGLQPVDVLLRRVGGGRLDPLELPAGGPGVTGLFDSARNGHVRILNHPGAAAIEAPAFSAFMPSLARRLLGEVLRLPTQPTVWLADDGAQRMVAQGFDRWSVRPALDGAAPPAPLNGLSREARAALEEQIAARPWAFAGCTSMAPSLAPSYGPGGLAPKPVVLRLFLMHDGAAWRMMQGGLARVLSPGEHVTETLPTGALFKDVWVLSEDSGMIQGPEPAPQPLVTLRRTAGNLPSRVADDFFWLGRYVERLEAQARLGRAGLLRRARGAPLPREIAELDVLGRCLQAAGVAQVEPGTPLDGRIRQALLPRGAMGGGLDNVARLIEALRDRMTVETHGAFSHALRAARTDVADADHGGLDGLVHAMTGLQRLATTVAGVAAEGMVRGGGRLFLDLGRRTERAMVGGYVLATVLNQPPERIDGTLRLVLELCDSAITYRSRYLSVLQPAPVLDLVLADTGNPRALAFQFEQAAALLDNAGDRDLALVARQWEQQVAALVDQVAQSADPADAAHAIANRLIGVGNGAADLSDRITRRFFALLPKLQAVGLETA